MKINLNSINIKLNDRVERRRIKKKGKRREKEKKLTI